MEEESGVLIEGLEETTESINVLLEKLKEAKSIADDLTSIKITLSDKRQKDIMEYVIEARTEFIKRNGNVPSEFYLVAAGNSFEVRIGLNV